MTTSIIHDVNKKYNTKFHLLQNRWFNSVFSSDNYILNIFPVDYELHRYQENYKNFINIHNNIPEIIFWDFEHNYYIQNKILNTIDNWGSKENIKKFFSWYLNNYYSEKSAVLKKTENINKSENIDKYWSLYENIIKKLYPIYKKQDIKSKKIFLWNLIQEITENKFIFSWESSGLIHWDLSDSNILFSDNKFNIIDFENITYFDIYYDLVSFDYFSWNNNLEIYSEIFKDNNKIFQIKRYKIMEKLFTFIQKNNLWNLI